MEHWRNDLGHHVEHTMQPKEEEESNYSVEEANYYATTDGQLSLILNQSVPNYSTLLEVAGRGQPPRVGHDATSCPRKMEKHEQNW